MSVSFSAYLVVGVPYHEAVKVVQHVESVTRYDEKTGKPYQKEVKSEKEFLFGKEMKGDELLDLFERPEAWDGKAPNTFRLHSGGEDLVIGLQILKIKPDMCAEDFLVMGRTNADLEKDWRRAEAAMKEIGWNPDKHNPLRWWVIPYASY